MQLNSLSFCQMSFLPSAFFSCCSNVLTQFPSFLHSIHQLWVSELLRVNCSFAVKAQEPSPFVFVVFCPGLDRETQQDNSISSNTALWCTNTNDFPSYFVINYICDCPPERPLDHSVFNNRPSPVLATALQQCFCIFGCFRYTDICKNLNEN